MKKKTRFFAKRAGGKRGKQGGDDLEYKIEVRLP